MKNFLNKHRILRLILIIFAYFITIPFDMLYWLKKSIDFDIFLSEIKNSFNYFIRVIKEEWKNL